MCVDIDSVLYLLVDESFQYVKVYDLDKSKEVYSGTADNVPDTLRSYEIASIDCVTDNTICFNINSEE